MSWRAAAFVALLGMALAACGGGGSSKKGATGTSDAAGTAPEQTTTSTSVTESSVVSPPTSATAGTTPTTTKKTTPTTARNSAPTTQPKGVTNVNQNLTNITQAPTTAPPSDIQPGGTLTYARAPDVASLDPVRMGGVGAQTDGPQGYLIYDYLIYTDDATGQLVPQTAESFTSADAITWTLKLRPNIKFSDGTSYDAAAVKFNIERYQDPKNASALAPQVTTIASMDVIDATTLRLTLKARNGVFPLTIRILNIGSPTAIQAQGSKYGGDANVVGAGPYLLKSWTRDSESTFVRNPTYWRAPQPYIDQIIMKPIVDESQRVNTFTSGGADMVWVGSGPNAQQVAKSSNAVQQTSILNGGISMRFNTKTKPFSDPRARQAIGLAIDPVEYTRVVNNNFQDPVDSMMQVNSPFYDKTIVQQLNDPAKAKALAEAVAKDNGGTFEFTATTFQVQNYMDTALYVQGALARVGIKMNIVAEGTVLHIQNGASGNYSGASISGLIFADPEPTWTQLFACGNPSTGWCNTKFDALASDNRITLDAKQRVADIKEMQRIFYDEVPLVVFERRYTWHFTRPNLQNFRAINEGNFALAEAWIKR